MADTSITERVPFDPREIGPITLARIKIGQLKRWADRNSRVLIIAWVALTIAGWYLGVSIPKIPSWVLVAVGVVIAAAPTSWLVGKGLVSWLYSPDDYLLSVQNPVSGDQDLILLSPDRFDALTVINHNGQQREGTEFLRTIRVNGRRAYEVDRYDPETNHALASWQAGISTSDIRADRHAIDRIRTRLAREANEAMELRANYPELVREGVIETSHELLRVAERVELPGETKPLKERLTDIMERRNIGEELLDGVGSNGQSDGESRNGHDEDGDAEAVEISGEDGALDVFGRAIAESLDRSGGDGDGE